MAAMQTTLRIQSNTIPEVGMWRVAHVKISIEGRKPSISCDTSTHVLSNRILKNPIWTCSTQRHLICSAARSRAGATTDSKGSELLVLDNVKYAVDSRDDDKMTVRVELAGETTEKAFDHVLANLAKSAPPVPGFRRMQGGKTNVPKSFFLQQIGRDRVTRFTIQEILSSSMDDFVKKENLEVKKTFRTTQSAEELEAAFSPGNDFGFNVTLEFEKTENQSEKAQPDFDDAEADQK